MMVTLLLSSLFNSWVRLAVTTTVSIVLSFACAVPTSINAAGMAAKVMGMFLVMGLPS